MFIVLLAKRLSMLANATVKICKRNYLNNFSCLKETLDHIFINWTIFVEYILKIILKVGD